MCGIAGSYSLNYRHDTNIIERVLESLSHRGPDGSKVAFSNFGFMVHTRLSIIDPGPGGVQPFVKFNGRLVTAHNGEIYNHKHLRKKLTSKYTFEGNTDSEIIPLLYTELGPKAMCEVMEGMFAFAIFDNDERALYLGRDTFGIKPLYYSIRGGSIIFGSEIKALLSVDSSISDIYQQAILDFLTLGYIPEPDTIFEDIKAVPRGTILKFSLDTGLISVQAYGDNFEENYSGCDKAELDELLHKVITEQSVADFPVGALLSGGVDSTLVASYFSETSSNPKTFTVSFSSMERDESDIAKETSDIIGSEHHQCNIGSMMNWEQFQRLILHFDQPFSDLSFIPTFIICNQVREYVKVVLSGDGGDEFAAGYPKFRYFRILQKFSYIPLNIRYFLYRTAFRLSLNHKFVKFLKLSTQSPSDQIYGLSAVTPENLARSFFLPNHDYLTPGRHFTYDQNLDFTQNISINQCNTSLLSKMLPKVDRMSMLAGVEARVPLLDTRITRCLYSMKSDNKLRGKIGKVVFRDILRKKLPSYTNIKKTGFDFDHSEITNLGWTTKMISEIYNSKNDKTILWDILDYDAVCEWLKQQEAGLIRNISLQSQFQLIVNLYSIVFWFNNSKCSRNL